MALEIVPADTVTSRQANPQHFSEGIWQAEILPARVDGGMRGVRFVYPPGARSGWHVHDGEQALFVLAGRGIVARWGEDRGTAVAPGDAVHIFPGEKHWHGAVGDDAFVHLAITASGGTIWHEPVSDDQYARSLLLDQLDEGAEA